MSDNNQDNNLCEGDDNDFVRFVLVDQDKYKLEVRFAKDSYMGKLRRFYSTLHCTSVKSIKFLYDGRYINDEHTPGDLGMKEDDVIEVFIVETNGDGPVTG